MSERYRTLKKPKVWHIGENGQTLCGKNTNFFVRFGFGQKGDELPACPICEKAANKKRGK